MIGLHPLALTTKSIATLLAAAGLKGLDASLSGCLGVDIVATLSNRFHFPNAGGISSITCLGNRN